MLRRWPRGRWRQAGQQQAREFWDTLSLRARLLLAAAVFASFAPIGLLTDIMGLGRLTLTGVAVAFLGSGLLALGYAWAVIRDLRLMAGVLLAHMGLAVALDRVVPSGGPLTGDALAARLQIDAIGTVLSVAAAYAFFVTFIRLEGARHLRALAEIRLARDIHRHLAPGVTALHGAFEMLGSSTPSGDVGGDLVDFVAHEGGGWTAGVFDVSGHGVASGVLMAVVKSAFRSLLTGPDVLRLPDLLTRLDAVVGRLARPGMFVTALLVQQDAEGNLSVARAGHLPAFVVRGDTGAIEPHGAARPALGLPMAASFDASPVESRPGDLWVLMSDGLTEVFDRRGRELGVDAVLAVVAGHRTASLADIRDAMLARVAAHGPQADDQTLLLIRHRPPRRLEGGGAP